MKRKNAKIGMLFGIAYGCLLLLVCSYFLVDSVLKQTEDYKASDSLKEENKKKQERIPTNLTYNASQLLPYIVKTTTLYDKTENFDEREIVRTLILYLENKSKLSNGKSGPAAISKGDLHALVSILNPKVLGELVWTVPPVEIADFSYTVRKENGIYIFEFTEHDSLPVSMEEIERKFDNNKIIVTYGSYCIDKINGQKMVAGKLYITFVYDLEKEEYVLETTKYQKKEVPTC